MCDLNLILNCSYGFMQAGAISLKCVLKIISALAKNPPDITKSVSETHWQ